MASETALGRQDMSTTRAEGGSSSVRSSTPRLSLLTVSLDPDTNERLELAAALNGESPSSYVRKAVHEVIDERLTRPSPEDFRRQVDAALSSEPVVEALDNSLRVAVRVDEKSKERLDFLGSALRRSVASLVREGLRVILERALGDKDIKQLRAEVVDRYDAQRTLLLRS
jgi:predicted DNA-binding protein